MRRMRAHLYLLVLAAGISAASQTSSLAELLTLLQQMWEVMARDSQNLRIETPDNINDVNCISTIFEGTEQLKTNPALKKFSAFFQTFERLKPFLTPRIAKEGKCDTEGRHAKVFIGKLMTFIRRALKARRT